MPASMRIPDMLPGVHRVRKKRADGGLTVFWYAWRGGPQILRASAVTEAELAREVAKAFPAAATAYQAERAPKSDTRFLYGLITRYLSTPDFANLAPRTQRDKRKFLDMAREKYGQLEIKALEARGARSMLLAWRDEKADRPKTADEMLGALSSVLTWAADRGELRQNPVAEFPRLYRCNRAEMVWTPQDLERVRPHCASELWHAIQLAALTGLRLGDLIALTWASVGDHAITRQTNKSRGRKTAVVPITPETRAVLDSIPRHESVTVLNSARRRPWSPPGLESALRRAKIDAGITGLRFHDLRGTAATNFVRAGLPLDEVATVLAWEKHRVEEIAARYVTAEVIGLAMVERLRQNRSATETVNRAVNHCS